MCTWIPFFSLAITQLRVRGSISSPFAPRVVARSWLSLSTMRASLAICKTNRRSRTGMRCVTCSPRGVRALTTDSLSNSAHGPQLLSIQLSSLSPSRPLGHPPPQLWLQLLRATLGVQRTTIIQSSSPISSGKTTSGRRFRTNCDISSTTRVSNGTASGSTTLRTHIAPQRMISHHRNTRSS